MAAEFQTAADSDPLQSHIGVAHDSGELLRLASNEASGPAVRPTPLNYPILVLPPGDDPHRIGLVRLLLVVSSEGKVVNVIIAAATMPQDYVARVVESFEDMRFNPGLLHGTPHPSWYEVVVNFDFAPEGATLL